MHCSIITARFTGVFFLLMPALLMAQGQQGSGSPYSAYGLGDLSGASQISQATMGGISMAVVDPVSVVSANPASYAFLQRTTFEQGLVFRTSKYDTESAKALGGRTDLLGLTLGIPFGRGRWGMALGLNPVSNVGYRIDNLQPNPTGTGSITYRYTGDGGLNRAFLGVGHAFSEKRDSLNNGHRFSIGANLGYVFGRIEEVRQAIYPQGTGYYGSNVYSSLVLRDPIGNIGLMYQGDLLRRTTKSDKPLYFMAGAAIELPSNLGARRTDLVNSFGVTSTGVQFPVDTALYTEGARGTVGLPVGLGVGFTVFNQKWTVSAEVKQRDWRKLTLKVEDYTLPSRLATSTTYSLGASFRPAEERGGNFWQRTTYRTGFRYNNDYLVVDDHQLQEIGMSFGLSMPVLGSTTRSRFNFGAELGQRGTTDNGLIKERYASWYIGFTITPDIREQWFKKRRIE